MNNKIWIDKYYVPIDERENSTDYCQEIILPDKCNDCGNKIIICTAGGPNIFGSLMRRCKHLMFWRQVWEQRVINTQASGLINQPVIGFTIIKARQSKVSPEQDGMKCSGLCGNWMPMVAANQADGSFICYGCRSKL